MTALALLKAVLRLQIHHVLLGEFLGSTTAVICKQKQGLG